MKKRLLAIATILTAVVGAIVLTLALLPPKPGVTKANFDRVANGMSVEEVESVFGDPGGHVVQFANPKKRGVRTPKQTLIFDDPRWRVWQGMDGFAVVEFNENGQVEIMSWDPIPISFWQKLQRWLPWLPD
jgi:hypothetical protein